MSDRICSGKNRRRIRLLAVLLAATVTVSGCSVGKKKITLETGDISASSVVMMVGDQQVRYSEVQAYRYFLKCQYEGNFGKKLWDYPLSESETIGDQAKQEIVNMITQLKIISNEAKKQNVTLTADEKDQAVRNAQELLASATEKQKEKFLLNVQELSEIYQENALANKMFYVATNDADTNITDNEARQVSIQYIQIVTKGTDRNGTKIDMDMTEKADAQKRAKRLRKEAVAAEDFLGLAQKSTEAVQAEMMVGRDSEELESSILREVLQMKSGDLSPVLAGDEGYYIVYCVNEQDEDATYQKKEEIIEQRQTEMFTSKYTQWMKEQDVDINQQFWNDFSI